MILDVFAWTFVEVPFGSRKWLTFVTVVTNFVIGNCRMIRAVPMHFMFPAFCSIGTDLIVVTVKFDVLDASSKNGLV